MTHKIKINTNYTREELIAFVTESNKIEGILREPTQEELDEAERFLSLPKLTVEDIVQFVSVYQPNAELRDKYTVPGVRVGSHIAPPSGPEIKQKLEMLLGQINGSFDGVHLNSWDAHVEYETLHPFTDGNGRSGRIIWAWQQRSLRLGFLHAFYYQTLDRSQVRTNY
jgi:hypothetical protein